MSDKQTEQAFHWIIDHLEALAIPYQLTGGFAARVYGADRPLYDIDIDVPEERLSDIARVVSKEYVTFGPDRYQDEQFDIALYSLIYLGQEIDLAGIGTGRLFNKETQVWEPDIVDLAESVTQEVYGRMVQVVPRTDLIAYKQRLARSTDLQDVQLLTMAE